MFDWLKDFDIKQFEYANFHSNPAQHFKVGFVDFIIGVNHNKLQWMAKEKAFYRQ